MPIDVWDTSFRPCGVHGLRYPFRMRYEEANIKTRTKESDHVRFTLPGVDGAL
jgi:hypothetical protein